MFDKRCRSNWHLRFRLKIEELKEEIDYLNMYKQNTRKENKKI